MVLVDAGPLIALIHADDNHHERCVATLRSLDEPLGTVWPALTETMDLLNFSWKAQEALWEMLERGFVVLLPVGNADLTRIRELMKKYRIFPWTWRTLHWWPWPNERRSEGSSPWIAEILRSTVR